MQDNGLGSIGDVASENPVGEGQQAAPLVARSKQGNDNKDVQQEKDNDSPTISSEAKDKGPAIDDSTAQSQSNDLNANSSSLSEGDGTPSADQIMEGAKQAGKGLDNLTDSKGKGSESQDVSQEGSKDKEEDKDKDKNKDKEENKDKQQDEKGQGKEGEEEKGSSNKGKMAAVAVGAALVIATGGIGLIAAVALLAAGAAYDAMQDDKGEKKEEQSSNININMGDKSKSSDGKGQSQEQEKGSPEQTTNKDMGSILKDNPEATKGLKDTGDLKSTSAGESITQSVANDPDMAASVAEAGKGLG